MHIINVLLNVQKNATEDELLKIQVEHNVSRDNFNEVCMYLSSICVAIEPDVQRTDDQASQSWCQNQFIHLEEPNH